MRLDEITTTDIAQFGSRERLMLISLLTAWEDQGLPSDFSPYGVKPMMNKHSGHVFLINDDYETAMMNGDKLETWYYCGNCGNDGFHEDCTLDDDGKCNGCNED